MNDSFRTLPDLRSRPNGFTLLELVAVIWILAVLLFLAWSLWPRLTICRSPSTLLVCASNLKGIGTALAIYAIDHGGVWPVPAFDETMIGRIDYTVRVVGGAGSVRSPNRMQPSQSGPGGARQLAVTRSFWMLVRSGDTTERQFICPVSGDVADPASNVELYYDFAGPDNISYGFQVPFGPRLSRAGQWMDSRLPVAADKGPYRDATVPAPPMSLLPISESGAAGDAERRSAWRPFNSRNHGGDGQNVLFADGHVKFHRTPTAGIDFDNIYTAAFDNEHQPCRASGESPWVRSPPPFLSRSDDGAHVSSTDSLIYP